MTSSALSGAYLLQDIDSLSESIRSGDWAGTALNLLSTGLDTAAAIMDPIGTLIANGLGWLIDHLQPLKGWFDDLTGHADQVKAFAATWKGVAADLHAAGAHYRSGLAGFDSITGVTATTYRELGGDIAKHVDSAGRWSEAIATGLEIAATLVQTVHDLVRDVLSQIVGSILAAVGEALATVGVGLAEIVPALITRVGELAARIGKDVTSVIETVKNLTGKIHTVAPEIEKIGKEMAAALHNLAGGVKEGLGGAAASAVAFVAKVKKAFPSAEEIKVMSREEREALRGVDRGDGRDIFGHYTTSDVPSANREAAALAKYGADNEADVIARHVRVKFADGDQERYFDGLVKKPDGTYHGIEVKSGSAFDRYSSPGHHQNVFDGAVSYDHPAVGKLDGVQIQITSRELIKG